MYRLVITPDFSRQLKSYLQEHSQLTEKLTKTFKQLLADPDHPSLRTHKLESGDFWSVSVDDSFRILFKIQDGDLTFSLLGTHDEVY